MKLKINIMLLSLLAFGCSNAALARTFQIGGGTGGTPTTQALPQALNDSATVVPNSTPVASGDVTANDSNGITATLASPAASEYGYIIFNNDGSYTYTVYESAPAVLALLAGEVVVDSFNYVYSNAAGQSATATLNVQIIGNPVGSNAIRALNDSATVVPNSTPVASGDVTANDSNGITATLASPAASEYGYIIFNNDGSYTYTLREDSPLVVALLADEVAVDSFNYVYSNAAGQSATATLNVQIIGNPVGSNAVRALNDSATVVPNSTPVASGNVTANDSNGLFATLISSPAGAYGNLIFANDGGYTYTVNEGSPAIVELTASEVVMDSFKYSYANADGDSATATLNIQIIGNPVDNDGNTLFEQPEDTPFDNVDIEPNNRSSAATPLNSGLNIKGHLQASGDKDWFVLTSAGNETITLEMCPQSSSCFGKKSWVLYVFDSALLTSAMEERVYNLTHWVDQTGTSKDLLGDTIIEPVIGNSNHMYLAYRTGFFDEALIGIIDPCFGSSNSVDIGVGDGERNYFIAISSPLKGDSGASDSCGVGSVVLQRPGLSAAGHDADGKVQSYATTEEYISAFPNSDDQYAIQVTATGINPLLSQTAQNSSSTFNANNGKLQIPKLRVFDRFYKANLSLQQYIEGSADNNRLQFTLANLDMLTVEEVADGFQASYNPETMQVIIPRVTVSSGEAYSVILQYYPAVAGKEAWLDVIEVTLIQ